MDVRTASVRTASVTPSRPVADLCSSLVREYLSSKVRWKGCLSYHTTKQIILFCAHYFHIIIVHPSLTQGLKGTLAKLDEELPRTPERYVMNIQKVEEYPPH
jgi:hypothetical protein